MDSQFPAAGIIAIVFYLAIIAIAIISFWKVFEKAGKPGWASIVPIYNIIVLLEIIEKPLWWIFLLFLPIVNFVIAIIMYVELAKSFGKSSGFGIGIAFLPFIFIPMLAFGDAQYRKLGGMKDIEDHLVGG